MSSIINNGEGDELDLPRKSNSRGRLLELRPTLAKCYLAAPLAIGCPALFQAAVPPFNAAAFLTPFFFKACTTRALVFSSGQEQ